MPRHLAVALLVLALAAGVRAEQEDLDTVLKRLDARASELEAKLTESGKKDAHVAALVGRHYASELAPDRDRDYLVATYSFEHATRDDPNGVVRNDWDIEFGNSEGMINVRMVTDDSSRVWDVGEVDFDSFTVRALGEKLPKGAEQAFAEVSHVYVVHTLDTETNLWAKMEVLDADPARSMIFRWQVIDDPTDVETLERARGPVLSRGLVRIQLRVGAMGGNPCCAFMDGTVNAYVGKASEEPLDLTGTPGIDDREGAHVDGGYIPRGKVWIVKSIDLSGKNVGDSNGDGPCSVSIGGKELLHVEERSGAFRKTWSGRIVVRPGQEHTICAEVSNSSFCEAVFPGALLDEKWADAKPFPALTGEEEANVDRLVGDLDNDDPELRDGAVRDLVAMGPPIAARLRAIKTAGRSAELQARLKDVLERIAGE